MAATFTDVWINDFGAVSTGTGLGGTASYGDYVVLCVVIPAGSALPALGSGGSAYVLVKDVTTADNRIGLFVKHCEGGEGGVGVVFGSPTDVSMVGSLVQGLGGKRPYLLDDGAAVYTPGVGNAFTDTVAMTSNAQPYMGWLAVGPFLIGTASMTDQDGGRNLQLGTTPPAHAMYGAWHDGTGTTTATRPVIGNDTSGGDLDMRGYGLFVAFAPGTVVHQFEAGHDGGSGPPVDRVDTVSIGGTASAADWLMAVTTGVAGAWDEVPVITDDVSGSTGWEVVFDTTQLGGENLRVIGHRKLCVGGETQVVATWSGPVNHGIVGAWIADPTLPDLVFLSYGNDGDIGGGNLGFTNTAPIPSDHATYIGGVAWGNGGVSNANFVHPPSPSAEGGLGYLTAGDGTGGIQHYNADEAGTTADVLQYEYAPTSTARVVMYWWATAEGGSDVAGHADGGLMLGSAEPTVTTDADGRARGGLMLGDATPEVTGGFDEGQSEGGLIGGRSRGTIVPAFPPIPESVMSGQLGCGVYDVFIFTRGLATIVGRIPFNEVRWTRVLDDTSSATITVDGVSNVGVMAHCCQLLGAILPWEHEVGVYRNGERVWSGPVQKVSFPSEQVIIDAADLSVWLEVRELHEGHNFVAPNADLANNWVALVEDAMSVENSAGLHPHVQALTGIQGERLYTPDMGVVAADAISELARTGLDWSCVDRVMTGGPVAVQPPAYTDAQPIPTLVDESFRDAPTIDRDGAYMGDCWFVGGSGQGPGGNAIFGEYGPAFPATDDHVAQDAAPDYAEIEEQFGRIERRVNETKILDQPSIDQNAATRYDLTKRPVDVISSGTLLPSAGIDIRQLTPGSIQNVHLTRACVQIGAPYRLKQLSVTAQNDGAEQVEGIWEPIGSTAAHEDL